ncbi:hypothetical protein DMUE_1418 [Dictyocoela muelleri]|nr:hypothetical protein DMUE_1418 [Dictyocoela muelleri]
MPAEKCVALLQEKLAKHKFNINTDILAIITDGASVMKKVGKILNLDQQLCFAHGVQLGVIDVLYNNISQGTSLYCDEEFISSESDSSLDQDILDEEAFIDIIHKDKKNK